MQIPFESTNIIASVAASDDLHTKARLIGHGIRCRGRNIKLKFRATGGDVARIIGDLEIWIDRVIRIAEFVIQ